MAVVGVDYQIMNPNPFEYRPEWGRYRLDEIDDIFSCDVVCWLPIHLPATKYTEVEIYELTQWLRENLDSIWEGPIGYLGFWKFRFTCEEDIVAVKLYI